MSATAKSLLTPTCPENKSKSCKITVVGCGQVGMACVAGILGQQICTDICIIDANDKRAIAEAVDLSHGCPVLHGCPKIYAGDSCASSGSDIVVVTAGARQKEGETRLSLVQRNVDIFKSIIPNLARASPNCIFVIVTNPCDIMTYVTMKLSEFPPTRVFGSGCMLDSSRFRYLISKKLNVSPASVHAWIIGEHGDSSVPVWSGVNVSGVRLVDLNPKIGQPNDPDGFHLIPNQVVKAAYELIAAKGYTNWGIGYNCAYICNAIVRDVREVIIVSIYVTDCKYGIEQEVYLSLPCVVGSNGVLNIVNQNLSETEVKLLQKSANAIYEVQKISKM